MKDEDRDKLVAEFPHLFRQPDPPHFECRVGWSDLLRELFQRLTDTKLPADYKIVSVKEKYGGLNVWGYSDLEPDTSWWVRDIIAEYEQRSYGVCERCGSTSGVQFYVHDGWDQVGCYPCRTKVKQGWDENDEPSEHQDALEAIMGRLTDKLNEEVGNHFPEGTSVKIILRNYPRRSHAIVKTPDGRVCGF